MSRSPRRRQEWQFFGALLRAAPALATVWWVAARAARPAAGAVRGRRPAPWSAPWSPTARWPARSPSSASCSSLFQVLTPLHQAVGANLGSRAAAWLNDRLMAATCAGPPGIAHLERPELTNDLTMARDFDLGITGPPLVDQHGLHRERARRDGRRARVAAWCCSRFAWWAPLLLVGAWVLDALAAARERGLAGPQHRRGAHRAAPRRVRVPARGRRARGEGAAAVRPVAAG